MRWLARLVRWLSDPSRPTGAEAGARDVQAARLALLLNVVDRNPESKLRFARTLRSIGFEIDALELYCESGLPREPGFWGEAFERLLFKLLPTNPYRADLGSVLQALFPSEQDALWVARLDRAALTRVREALVFHEAPEEAGWNALERDLPDALLFIASDLRATGLMTPIRRRLDPRPFRELPFFGLTRAAEDAVAALRAGERPALAAAQLRLLALLEECRRATLEVHAHLDEHGVSLKVVYLVEKMQAQIRRAMDLIELLGEARLGPAATGLLVKLVHDSAARRSVGALAAQNLHLLAKKVVDRSAETGEHYIARSAREYRAMLRAALGGGALTAFTTWLKFLAAGVEAAPFVQGLLASLNYAASFVAIQLAHFTLATKQPAMTGPALAAKLEGVLTDDAVREFVDEVARLIRTQIAGILGNVGAVVPAMLAIALVAQALSGAPLLHAEKARYTIASFSIAGGAPFYAAFTGVLLWLSSLVAGWADNWFVLRKVGDGVAHSPRLRLLVGARQAERSAAWLQRQVGGLAGNVSLGFLLGLAPALSQFLGLPLDVRHVTLSSGALAAAVASLGWQSLLEPALWLSAAGVAAIGLLNVGVSFALALALAIRARAVLAPARHAIRRAIRQRLLRRPASFLFPLEATPAARTNGQ